MLGSTRPRTERFAWNGKIKFQHRNEEVKLCGVQCLRSIDFRCCQRFIDPRSSYGRQGWPLRDCFRCCPRRCSIYKINRPFTFHRSSIDFVRSLLFHNFVFGQYGFSYCRWNFNDIWCFGCSTSDPYQLSHSNFHQRFRICCRFLRWWRRWRFQTIFRNYFSPSWCRCVGERLLQSLRASIDWLKKRRFIVRKVIGCYKCRRCVCMQELTQKSWIHVNLWWWRNDGLLVSQFAQETWIYVDFSEPWIDVYWRLWQHLSLKKCTLHVGGDWTERLRARKK